MTKEHKVSKYASESVSEATMVTGAIYPDRTLLSARPGRNDRGDTS